MQEGILLADPSFRITFVNACMVRMLGLESSQLQGQSFFSLPGLRLLTPAPAPSFPLPSPGSEQYDMEFTRPDGSRFFGHASLSPFLNESGVFECVMVCVADISDRKQAEQALAASEAKWRSYISKSPMGVIIADEEGRLLEVNETACRMTRYSEAELLAKSIPDLLIPESMMDGVAHFRQVVETGAAEGVLRMRRGDGELFWAQVSAVRLSSTRFMAFVQDVTDREYLAQELRKSEQQYRQLFTSMISGFALHEIILDAQGHPCDYRFLSVNPAFEQLTGLKAQDVKGRTVREVLPSTEEAWIQRYGEVALSGKPLHFEEYSAVLGKHFEVMAYAPAPRQFATIFQDITDRKKSEQALRESEGRVRSKLEALLLPEGDIGTIPLSDIVDMPALQAMMNDFFTLTRIGVAILDLQGTVLVSTGWQDICTQFHRVHPEACKNCIESDTALSLGVTPGRFKLYRCKNNMWDMATPIMIGGKHLGNLFLGQFFFEDEEPDAEVFRAQAKQFGFNEKDYLEALSRAPRWSRETVVTVMAFYTRLATLISTLSYSNLKLARTLAERERAEEALRESEQRLHEVSSNVPGMLYQFEGTTLKEAQVTYFSQKGYDLFGVPSNLHMKELFPWFVAHVAEEHRPPFLASVEKAIQTGEPWTFEGRFIKPSGESLWFGGRSTAINKQGRVVHNGLLLDITARKTAEQVLQESEEKFAKAFQTSPYAIAITRASDGTFIDCNPAFTTITGYTWKEVRGNPSIRMNLWVNPDDRQRMVESVLSGRPVNSQEVLVRRKNGDLMTGLFSADIITLRNERCVLSSMNDVTELKKAEETLRANEEKYRALYDNVSVGVALISPQMEILDLNRKMREWFPAVDATQRPLCFSAYNSPPRAGPCSYCPTIKTLQDGLVHEDATETPTPQGIRHYRIVSSPLKDVDGKVYAAIELVDDITDQKQAEEKLKALTTQLRELAQHVQTAREDEGRRIAGRIHDEVGQLLTAVRMDTSLLEDALGGQEGEVRTTLASIKKTLDAAVKTVQNISMELRPGILDDFGLSAALEWSVREFEKRLKIPCRYVAAGLPENLPPLLATAFYRIAQESFTNIARHAQASEITVELSCEKGLLRLIIRDNGRGMDPARLADPSSFGLIQMRERAMALGGMLSIVGEQGRGTVVTATAPL